MTVAPMGYGRGLHLRIDFIHDGTLLIQIGEQVGIILYPRTDVRLALHFVLFSQSPKDIEKNIFNQLFGDVDEKRYICTRNRQR